MIGSSKIAASLADTPKLADILKFADNPKCNPFSKV
jgi:hypothetical protein